MLRWGLTLILVFFTVCAFAEAPESEELSPEVMDIIHNTVGMGSFSMSRKELREITRKSKSGYGPAHIDILALQPGSAECFKHLRKLLHAGKIKSLEMCRRKEKGYVTLTRVNHMEDLEFGAGRTLKKEIDAFNQMGSALVAVMYTLPEEITNWSKDEALTPQRWLENRTSAPVVDKDDWYVNWIGHPLAGAFYFTGARQTGATNMQSFGFSVLMSTFQWEFGNEALVENPSLQDLLITPVVGSVLGMGLHGLNEHIQANDGKWMGSQFMGKFGLLVSDPSGAFQGGLDKMSKGRIQDFKMGFRAMQLPNEFGYEQPFFNQQIIGFGFDFKFDFKRNTKKR